tara:strand:- start:3674 stop:3847 length:174 start_codon:yes stop_codon:yes gene_type:complete
MIYDKVIYLSDMTIRGWITKFKEIRNEFNYKERDDYNSAKKLNSIIKKNSQKNNFKK